MLAPKLHCINLTGKFTNQALISIYKYNNNIINNCFRREIP